jgi:hypothetical protein
MTGIDLAVRIQHHKLIAAGSHQRLNRPCSEKAGQSSILPQGCDSASTQNIHDVEQQDVAGRDKGLTGNQNCCQSLMLKSRAHNGVSPARRKHRKTFCEPVLECWQS